MIDVSNDPLDRPQIGPRSFVAGPSFVWTCDLERALSFSGRNGTTRLS
jgi:hypothetical protein